MDLLENTCGAGVLHSFSVLLYRPTVYTHSSLGTNDV